MTTDSDKKIGQNSIHSLALEYSQLENSRYMFIAAVAKIATTKRSNQTFLKISLNNSFILLYTFFKQKSCRF